MDIPEPQPLCLKHKTSKVWGEGEKMMQNRIRQLREEKHMTQLRLSTELGMTQETISAYETGKHLPGLGTLIALAD